MLKGYDSLGPRMEIDSILNSFPFSLLIVDGCWPNFRKAGAAEKGLMLGEEGKKMKACSRGCG